MKISIIGAGAMGGTTAEGLLKQRHVSVELTVSDPNADTRQRMAALGATVTADNRLAASEQDVVMVVVKPWLVCQVLEGIREALNTSRILIVVAAGVSSASVREASGRNHFFLAIPNIAIAQLASMTFVVPVQCSGTETQQVLQLFNAVGQTLITDEQHLPAGTTLASCGLAYALRYIRAASEGGVELGFRADDAKDIVAQTVEGAVRLLKTTGMHPEQAIDMVTTPGGVTIKGLNEMEHAGFTSAVIRGLKAGVS